MNDRKLYEQILGITAPWIVSAVELKLDQGLIEIRVETGQDGERCADCGERCGRYDTAERRWRHLDTCQYQTILVASVPRVNCRDHGVKQVRVPWAEQKARFTALFEALVIEWLHATENIAAVAKGLRLTWDEVDGIRSRAVKRGLQRRGRASLPAHVGVDETAIKRGYEYITVINDLESGVVLDVTDDRTQKSLSAFWDQYTPGELDVIQKVAMDMWQPFIAATRKALLNADLKIVFDKFHILNHIAAAVDKVRRGENRELRGLDDNRLVKTKYLWLSRPQNLERDARRQIELLRRSSLKTARAYRYKEQAAKLWGYLRRSVAERVWRSWLRGASRCLLEPIREVARMIRTHWDGVINAATSPVTNAMSESINSHIQRIKKRACGFRSRVRFREAILFHLGGLDLRPEVPFLIHSNH